MADSYIQVADDGNGKKMQTFVNNVSGNSVHAEGVALVDNTGTYISTLPVSISSNINIGANVTVIGPLTNAQLRASPVTVDAGGNTVPVSGTFWQTTQPVSGPLTNAELRASPVAVTGTFWQTTQPVSGIVTANQSNASNFLATVNQGSGSWYLNAINTAVTVISPNASNFLATVSGTVAATQSGTWNIGTLTTVTNPVDTHDKPDATSTYAPDNATTSAYASSLVIKGSAGVLFAITGYSSSTSDQWIQLHNAASLPADTSVPVITFLVRAGRNFSLSFGGKFGRFFSTGIVICNSSTGPTKTLGSSDCWFDAQYK